MTITASAKPLYALDRMNSIFAAKIKTFNLASPEQDPKEKAKEMAKSLLELTARVAAMKDSEIALQYSNLGLGESYKTGYRFHLSTATKGANFRQDFDALVALCKSPSRDTKYRSDNPELDALKAGLSWQTAEDLSRKTGYGENTSGTLYNLAHGINESAQSLLASVLYPQYQKSSEALFEELKSAGASYLNTLVKHFESLIERELDERPAS